LITLTAYHGTRSEFAEFETGHDSPSGLAAGGVGFYFHADIRLAEPFAGDDGRVISAELSLKNPARLEPAQCPGQEASAAEARDFTRGLVAAGHDALIIEHEFSGPEIVVFDAACIRILDPAMSLADRSAARAAATAAEG
jgi:hypothetical protein